MHPQFTPDEQGPLDRIIDVLYEHVQLMHDRLDIDDAVCEATLTDDTLSDIDRQLCEGRITTNYRLSMGLSKMCISIAELATNAVENGQYL